jgi:2-polyprenyl-3-methyl-5-hydroxy-6-metoxy-1,4-benzoquinol methylase
MKRELLCILRCPTCRGHLQLDAENELQGEVTSGTLTCQHAEHVFPIVHAIPRFVPGDNYAASFGWQWNRFGKTQLDSHSGQPISRDRFFAFTGWTPEQLAGKRVLDIGCGAGRFAEIALSCGAEVVAVDYSSAVDACWANHQDKPNLFGVLQADIYHLPLLPAQFDFVYCLGVLQHTPDVRAALMALPPQLKACGQLAVDVYPKQWRNSLWPRYWIRPITRRLRPDRLFRMVQFMVKYLLPVSVVLGRAPLVGRKLRHLIPLSNYDGILPLTEEQLREWATLDTFDMLAPAHDHPQTSATLTNWLHEAGLERVRVFRLGFLVGRGSRGSQPSND